jgi:hypothetical protein
MNTIDILKEYEVDKLVEVIPSSKLKEGDILIIRCDSSQSNQALKDAHSMLGSLMSEKKLKILAMPKNFDDRNLGIIVESMKLNQSIEE